MQNNGLTHASELGPHSEIPSPNSRRVTCCLSRTPACSMRSTSSCSTLGWSPTMSHICSSRLVKSGKCDHSSTRHKIEPWQISEHGSRPTDCSLARPSVERKKLTMSAVPTLAQSRMASAGTRPTSPCAVKDVVINAVAVLLCSRVVRPSPAAKAATRLLSAFESRWRNSDPKGSQNAGLDHAEAPEQQCDAENHIQKNHAAHQRPPPRRLH